jgi:hypothetical protein
MKLEDLSQGQNHPQQVLNIPLQFDFDTSNKQNQFKNRKQNKAPYGKMEINWIDLVIFLSTQW